jgi:N-carbamoyl-L-amino-acid hydrolase
MGTSNEAGSGPQTSGLEPVSRSTGPISAGDLSGRLSLIAEIGKDAGGTTRLAWSPEMGEAKHWFYRQARSIGLTPRQDPAGNLWAVPEAEPPWWVIGSHLDSVRQGGTYDGALGVVVGFEVASRSSLPLAVLSFADEEGARFNTPTFGSRALVGKLDLPAVLSRSDETGQSLEEAIAEAGLSPGALSDATEVLPQIRGFFELHIDQMLQVAESGEPVGVVSQLAARRRLRVDIRGRADHAGTTFPGERRDALSAGARLIIAAERLAQERQGLLAAATRLVVRPNAFSTVPESASLWIDARAATETLLDDWHGRFETAAGSLRIACGVEIEAETAASSPSVDFDHDLRRTLVETGRELGLKVGEFVSYAGHDAGILAEYLPAAMVLVRNPTGISHSPEESVDLEDAAAAANLLLATIDELAKS